MYDEETELKINDIVDTNLYSIRFNLKDKTKTRTIGNLLLKTGS